ncbi:MAG: TolB-like protein/Tfp pilus assembly protein PilF [Porticoccaceae bacterium]|jgi:TolB-like protein/Tfp pilus assembly protein PilF
MNKRLNVSNIRESSDQLINISLFGVFDYRDGNLDFVSLKSRKAEAILLCLAMNGLAGFEREHLSRIVWPDLSEQGAKAGLRQALARIRRTFGDVFETPKTGWVSLSAEKVNCDLWAINSVFNSQSVVSFACGWPTEPFLVNFPVPSDLFSEWMERARGVKRDDLKKLAIKSLVSPNVAQSDKNGIAQTLLLLDDVDEKSISTVLKFLKESARIKQYVNVLEAYKSRLQERYDLEPSSEFLVNYDQVPEQQAPKTVAVSPSRHDDQSFGRPALTVNQFEVHGLTDELKFLGIGFTEEIVARLSTQNWFTVNIKDPAAFYSPPRVGRLKPEFLSNAYSVIGSIYASQDELRISVKLVDELSESVKWSRTYPAPLDDIFNLQQEIVASIAEVLTSNVISVEANTANSLNTDLAQSLWLETMQARYLFWRMNRKNNAKARELLDDVFSHTETPSVPAFVMSTFVRMLDVWSLWSANPVEDADAAIRFATRATRIYPSDPWTFFSLGTALGLVDRLELAVETFNRALSFNSNFAAAIGAKGKYQIFLGELEEAKKNLNTSIKLNDMDPHYGLWQNAMGIACYLEGDYETALRWSERAISTTSFWGPNYLLSAASHFQMNQMEEAEKSLAYAQKMLPNMTCQNLHPTFPFQIAEMKSMFFSPLQKLGLPK